jgi:glycosyltransferase involved in cell wall biosynthesis
MKDIAIILPTLNEEKALGAVIAGIKKELPYAKIIVADDSSEDGTEKIAASFSGVIFLDRKNEREKGLCASVLHAMQKYPHEFYIVMDADGQHPAEALPELAAALGERTVVVMCRKNPLPPLRQAISIGAAILAKARLMTCGRMQVADPMSGFFGIDRKTAMAAMERGHFVKNGFKVLLDFLKSAPEGTKIVQVPYDINLRKAGASKLGATHVVGLLQSVLS